MLTEHSGLSSICLSQSLAQVFGFFVKITQVLGWTRLMYTEKQKENTFSLPPRISRHAQCSKAKLTIECFSEDKYFPWIPNAFRSARKKRSCSNLSTFEHTYTAFENKVMQNFLPRNSTTDNRWAYYQRHFISIIFTRFIRMIITRIPVIESRNRSIHTERWSMLVSHTISKYRIEYP